jgi:hypothetical protein
MRTLWRWSFILTVLASALALYSGCSKEASFEPLFDINPGERFKSDTLTAVESAWFNKGSSGGPGLSSRRMVVCNWKGYDSRGFLRFTAFPDTAVTVDSAQLYLWANRLDGDLAGAIIDIHTLVDTLEQNDLYWEDMPGLSAEPIADFKLPSEPGSLFVDITETVTSWVKREGTNYGIALKARDETGPEFLVEFATREVAVKTIDDSTFLDLRPALRIAYVDTAGEDQQALSVATEDTFADTLASPLPEDELHLTCGSGFPSRSFVRFNIDTIPEGSTVSRSVMLLAVDSPASSFDSIGITCHAVLAYPWEDYDTRIGVSGTGTITIETDDLGADGTVDLDITGLVQPLVARDEINRGFAVKASNEAFDLDFVTFWSHLQPDRDLRPRLVVEYVLPPTPPYPEVKSR